MSTKRILVVDDEPDFVAVVKENLRHEGYDVEVAYNGIEALEKVKANPPDAIVLDVMMPEKDGYRRNQGQANYVWRRPQVYATLGLSNKISFMETTMPRIPRLLISDNPAVYHVISRTALDGLPFNGARIKIFCSN